MSSHPVQLSVRPLPMRRAQVFVRLVFLVLLGALSWSSIYWALYVALPLLVVLLLVRDGSAGYLEKDAPLALSVLRWLAGAFAYLWLLTDAFPDIEGHGPVRLTVDLGGRPTVASAVARLVTSFPALLLLALLSWVAVVVWIAGAVMLLVTGRVPRAIAGFLTSMLRYQFHFAAYHLSLVDAYPSLQEALETFTPLSRAARPA